MLPAPVCAPQRASSGLGNGSAASADSTTQASHGAPSWAGVVLDVCSMALKAPPWPKETLVLSAT